MTKYRILKKTCGKSVAYYVQRQGLVGWWVVQERCDVAPFIRIDRVFESEDAARSYIKEIVIIEHTTKVEIITP